MSENTTKVSALKIYELTGTPIETHTPLPNTENLEGGIYLGSMVANVILATCINMYASREREEELMDLQGQGWVSIEDIPNNGTPDDIAQVENGLNILEEREYIETMELLGGGGRYFTLLPKVMNIDLYKKPSF